MVMEADLAWAGKRVLVASWAEILQPKGMCFGCICHESIRTVPGLVVL